MMKVEFVKRQIFRISYVSFVLIIPVALFLSCNSSSSTQNSDNILTVFIGAASKPPMEEIIEAFQKETGIIVDANYGGSGYLLSQMKLSGKGDVFFPGSSDYMEIAKREKMIDPDSEKIVAYLLPSLCVQKGNPKNITCLHDLIKEDLRVVIANPEGVCLGSFSVEIIENNFSRDEIVALRKNIINYTESCAKTATTISLNMADVIIGWKVFESWDPERIESVNLKSSEIQRIGYLPVAITNYSNNKDVAQLFIDFILSKKGKEIVAAHHYFMTAEDVFEEIGCEKKIGGVYKVPHLWLTNEL